MDEKPPYAIIRVKKIHNPEDLDPVEAHNTRTIPAGTVEGAPAPVDWVNMDGCFRERAQQVLLETGATWEDTRGKGLRHKPLKQIKRELQETEKRLVEGQKLLDAAWADLAKKGEVLKHYDEQIKKQHQEVLRISNQNFIEELNNRAKATELRDLEEELVGREAESERRKTELDRREDNLNTRDAELAERESRLAAQLTQQAAERARLDQEGAAIENEKASLGVRKRAVEKREADVSDREEAVEDRERDLATTMAQIAILGRIITGKVKGTWNETLRRPEIANDVELPQLERKALAALMPPWLKDAMRLALGFAEKREKLRNRARKAIARLSQRISAVATGEIAVASRETAVAVREAEADASMRAANAAQTSANLSISEAKARDAAALATEAAAATRVLQATEKEAVAAKRIRQAEAAEQTKKELTAQLSEIRQEIAAAGRDAERAQARVRDEEEKERDVRTRVKALGEEQKATEAEVATAKQEAAAVTAAIELEKLKLSAVRSERETLQKELLELQAQRESLKADQASIQEDRATLENEKELDRISADMMMGILAAQRYARMSGQVIEVFPPGKLGGKPWQTLDAEGFAVWLPAMVNTYDSMFMQRAQAERTQKLWSESLKELARHYPDKRPELAQHAAKDKAAMAAIAAQNVQNGFGR
ncbi:hypothetical protein [Erythrobacter sp.]|uniref:hypothetical protein n=1 Tax=Erythrobacter sp. TaxID=1042 RepID=UPI0025E8A05F|nr:hypothetical protein [Erythrobacter sp.]